jgi:hypothetical protein
VSILTMGSSDWLVPWAHDEQPPQPPDGLQINCIQTRRAKYPPARATLASAVMSCHSRVIRSLVNLSTECFIPGMSALRPEGKSSVFKPTAFPGGVPGVRRNQACNRPLSFLSRSLLERVRKKESRTRSDHITAPNRGQGTVHLQTDGIGHKPDRAVNICKLASIWVPAAK